MALEAQEQGQQQQLQLGHLTSLSKLTLSSWAAIMQPEDQLPPNLQELYLVVGGGLAVGAGGSGCDLQPLLQLLHLQKLRLEYRDVSQAIDEAMRHVNSLTSLSELHLACSWGAGEAAAVDVPAALGCLAGLPLKSLSWTSADTSAEIPIAVLQPIRHLQGLTSLKIDTTLQSIGSDSAAAMAGQLAAILQPLTELRRLHLCVRRHVIITTVEYEASNSPEPCSSSGSHAAALGCPAAFHDDMYGVAALLRCVGALHKVEEVRVMFGMRVHDSVVQQLQAVLQLLVPSYMLPYCKVQAHRITIWL
jgi:hypothetical protein